MVTICAPAFANILMVKFEKLHIYPYLRNLSTVCCQFMDDVFLLWNGTESELIKFIDNPNKKHPKKSLNLLTPEPALLSQIAKYIKTKIQHRAVLSR